MQRVTVVFAPAQGSPKRVAATLTAVDASLDIAILELEEPQQDLIPVQVGVTAEQLLSHVCLH